MVTKHIQLDDTSMTVDELLNQLQPNTEILILRGDRVIARLESAQSATPNAAPRVLGLHEGQGHISDDFTDELSDSFWLGA